MINLRRVGMGCSGTLLVALLGCSSASSEAEGRPASQPPDTKGPAAVAGATANNDIGPQPSLPSAAGGATGSAPGLDGEIAVVDPVPESGNGFVVAAHDPLSTFAADVDTASYDLFRRDINSGHLPVTSSVRLEEYVNDFKYAYEPPAPDSDVPFSISLAAAPALYQRGTMLFRVGIRGKDAKPAEKLPTNLVFLVDTSGSMQSADKLPLVKRVLTDTLEVLAPNDTISIVTYAGNTRVALPPTKISQKAKIAAVIDTFSAGGSTAGAAGLDLAYQQAQAGFLEGGLNHVLVCTDGDFNVGPSSTAELVTAIEAKRKTGITLTMLGFGAGSNDAMMEAVSNKGNGVYGVISSAEQADRYVEERLLSTLTFIAKDMKIQVEFNPSHIYAYRLLGYEDRAIADDDFRDDAVDAGEVGAGHRVTALYELALTPAALPMLSGVPDAQDGAKFSGDLEVAIENLALVKIRYKDRDASESDAAHEVSAQISPADFVSDLGKQDGEFQWAAAVAAYSEIIKKSPFAAPESFAAIESIIMSQAGSDDADRKEMAELFAKAKPMLQP